jgi:hypothetical protein
MQILTNTETIRIGWYIPDLKPESVVGEIRSNNGFGDVQSQQLFEWYQKYKHRWLRTDRKERREESKEDMTEVLTLEEEKRDERKKK